MLRTRLPPWSIPFPSQMPSSRCWPKGGAAAIETAEDIRLELKQQMLRPVLWRQSLAAMAAAGVRTIVEVGPGRVLSALGKRTVPGVRAISMDGAVAPSLSNV